MPQETDPRDMGGSADRASRVRRVLKELRLPSERETDVRRQRKPVQGPNEPDDVYQQRLEEWESAVSDAADVPVIVAGPEQGHSIDSLYQRGGTK